MYALLNADQSVLNGLLLHQCFHKTLGTRRRQWPPSKQEILCTINRRPIYARFHFMDGQFHAIEFDPSATADEVARLVKAKIGLREGAMGYAIYEVLGTQERSLMPDEKVGQIHNRLFILSKLGSMDGL